MSIQSWVAIAVTLVTVWALIKRYETRLVLLAAGLFLCCISLDPMYGLDAMGKSMTNKSLIMAICGSMKVYRSCVVILSLPSTFISLKEEGEWSIPPLSNVLVQIV